MAEEFDTVSVDQLDPILLAVEQYLSVANVNGKLYKSKIGDFITFISPFITAVTGSGLVFPDTNNVLPNPTTTVKGSIVGAGTYTWAGGTLTTTSPFSIIATNTAGTAWVLVKGVNIDLSTYQNEIAALKATVGMKAKSYPIDFTQLGSQGGANNIYANESAKITTGGKLGLFRAKGVVGGTVTPYVYGITFANGVYTFTQKHAYASFTLTSTEQTADYSSDGYLISVGDYIAWRSTANVYYANTPGLGYAISENTTGKANNTTSYDFTIREAGASTLSDEVAAMSTTVANNAVAIASQTATIAKLNASSALYAERFAAILYNSPLILKQQPKLQVIVDGDSLDYGTLASSSAAAWPEVAKKDLDSKYFGDFLNFGVPGQTTTQMLSDQASQVIAAKNTADYDATVLVVGGGINDLMNGATPAAVYANQKQYHANARAANIATIVETLTATKNEYGIGASAGQTARLQYNSLIRTGVINGDFGTGAILIDLGLDPKIGVLSTMDTTLYSPDLQHFNDAGYAYKARLLEQGLLNKNLLVYLKTPTVALITASASGVILSWNRIKNAFNYTVLRSLTDNVTSATIVGNTSQSVFIDTSVTQSQTYYYFVIAKGDGSLNSFPAKATITTPAFVTNFSFDPAIGFNYELGYWTDAENKGIVAAADGMNTPVLIPNQLNGFPVLRMNKAALKTGAIGLTGNAPFSMVAVVKLVDYTGTGINAYNANLLGLGEGLIYGTIPSSAYGHVVDLIYYSTGKLTAHLLDTLAGSDNMNAPQSFKVIGLFYDGTTYTMYDNGNQFALSMSAMPRAFSNTSLRIGGGHYDSSTVVLESFTADYAGLYVNVSASQTIATFNAKIAAFKSKFNL